MSFKSTHVIAAACLVLVSWSSASYSAERAVSVLDDYYQATPPNSAYLGKMKPKWANYIKARQARPDTVDLMPAPIKPVSRLAPVPRPNPQTVRVTRVSPKFVRVPTVHVKRVSPKFVRVPQMTPKATVRRFMAPNRPLAQPTPAGSTERALPFWNDL
ncbi:hypothetical protein [Thiofilum flexile]|uniref:hypothetical protein n=1 Tax=Thiofilum flexile TaxID=125627 RepID=UPI000381C92A|nr:hypothetical protein [Thiofilum flexile]